MRQISIFLTLWLLTSATIVHAEASGEAVRSIRNSICYLGSKPVFSVNADGSFQIGSTSATLKATVYDHSGSPRKIIAENVSFEIFETFKSREGYWEYYYEGSLVKTDGSKAYSETLSGYISHSIDPSNPIWSVGQNGEYGYALACAPKTFAAPYYPTISETLQYLKTQTQNSELAEYLKDAKVSDYENDDLMRSQHAFTPWILLGFFNKDINPSENRMRRAEFRYNAFTREYSISPFRETMIEGP